MCAIDTDNPLIVRQSNDLINASYRIGSIEEGRLIRMLISQISLDDEDFKTYRISISDFSKYFGLSDKGKNIYALLKKAADELVGRKILLEKEDGSWLRMNWLSFAEYKKGNGFLEVRFDKELKPYLLGLKGYYTQYSLDKIINFRSIYSMRLFEILKKEEFKSNRGNFIVCFELNQFKGMLGVLKNQYPLFSNFRDKVIEIAVRDINNNTDFDIRVEYNKNGRKISNLIFECKVSKTQIPTDVVDMAAQCGESVVSDSDNLGTIKDLMKFGISKENATKWVKKYGEDRVSRNIAITKKKINSNNPPNDIAGYVSSAITNDFANVEDCTEVTKNTVQNNVDSASKEEKKENEVKKWIETTLNVFDGLPESRKQEIRNLYAQGLSDITRKSFQKSMERSPLHRYKFAEFFQSQLPHGDY